VQKERNYRSILQDNHGYGNVFSLQMWQTSTFSRELPEKYTRGHTDFIYGIELSLCGETLCKRRRIIEAFCKIIMDMGTYFLCKCGKHRLFQESFQKIPPEVTPIL
jgi:hypothetical protein